MAQKQAGKKKKPFSVFYRALILITVLLLVCITVGTVILNHYLKIYDDTDPLTEAETVFKTYYTTGNYLALIERSLGPEVDEERLNTELGDLLQGKNLMFRRSNASEEKAVYSVLADGAILSRFTLVPKPEKQSFERHLWELSEMTLQLDENGSPLLVEDTNLSESDSANTVPIASTLITIRIPVFLSLSVNGEMIESTKAVRTEPAEVLAYLPAGVTNEHLMYLVYRCDCESDTPEIILTDSAGMTYTPSYNREKGEYEYNNFSRFANDADKNLLTGRAIEAETAIEQYFAYDDINNDALRLVQNGTQFSRELLAVTAAQFVHDKAAFSKASASEFIRYDAKTVSCRVTMTHTMTDTATGTQQVDQNDYTLILCDDGTGNYLVYNRYSNK